MTLSRERKRALMRDALFYTADLVCEVVNTYEAFDELPHEERKFIDEYIVSIGMRLNAEADRRRRKAARGAKP